MKEALYPVSLDGAVETDAPSDFNVVVADDPSATSPFVYAIPAASLALAACGGGGGGSPTAATPPPPTVQVAKPTTEAEAARFILKSSLSVSDAEITNIKSIGYEPWLNAQMDAPISQTGVAWLSSRGYDQITTDNFFDNEYPGDYMIWNQLMSDANGVRKRVALALSEFFVSARAAIARKIRAPDACPTKIMPAK